MMPQVIRPSRWYYLLSLFILGAGTALFLVLLFKGIGGITDKLVQMEAPGTAEMNFSEPGKYTIFYEHQSVLDGKVYNTGENLSGLWLNVVSKETAAPVQLVRPSVNASYTVGNRSGVSILEFNIDRPGVYQVSATYSGKREVEQQVVLAIGQGVAGRIVGTVLGGLAVMFGSLLLAIAMAVWTFVKRRRAKKALTWTGYPTNPEAFAGR